MIHRALIHVAGPPGAGKTTLIERLLDRRLAYASYVRGERVAELSREEESAPREHPELRRVRELGAGAVALYRFPCPDSEAFYCSDLMADYSEAVVIEGDCPVEWVDLSVFVAPAPQPGESLLRRIVRDHAAEHRASLDHYAAVLASPDRLASFLAQELGRGVAAMALRRPGGLDELHRSMMQGLEKARKAPPPPATEHWALGERYAGLERAQVVVVNLRPDDDQGAAQGLCEEVPRLRKDRAVFDDVIGRSGNRLPVTAVVANLGDPQDPGLRRCRDRVKRTLRRVGVRNGG